MLSDVLGRSRATLALSTSFLSFPHPVEVGYIMVVLRYSYSIPICTWDYEETPDVRTLGTL